MILNKDMKYARKTINNNSSLYEKNTMKIICHYSVEGVKGN
jgi:hypothetical protein